MRKNFSKIKYTTAAAATAPKRDSRVVTVDERADVDAAIAPIPL